MEALLTPVWVWELERESGTASREILRHMRPKG